MALATVMVTVTVSQQPLLVAARLTSTWYEVLYQQVQGEEATAIPVKGTPWIKSDRECPQQSSPAWSNLYLPAHRTA